MILLGSSIDTGASLYRNMIEPYMIYRVSVSGYDGRVSIYRKNGSNMVIAYPHIIALVFPLFTTRP